MKKILLLLFISFQALSQSYSIRGSLVDTTGAPLEYATLFLLNPSDSTMLTFGRTDAVGKFEFKGVKKADVVLQATFVGYLPYKQLIKFDPSVLSRDLGTVKMKPIDQELYEVVIKTAKAPMSFKGDTVEYDASKFKVPPGSTVEDLLRRLPGFQVDGDGNIKAQGENITKVLVGGKRFFGSDPKAATKNLPSEAISKVQVFNDASEQSKVTGVSDGKTEKTLNLELKDEFKKGAFGKFTAGAGTEERVLAKGNYNRFDDKNQLSIIGFGNNINQSGLSNDDYQDFRGSQSYNWGDNVDFGFDSGGYFIFFGDDGNGESLGIPTSWGPDRGKSQNIAGGLNYNFDTKKNKISSNYFYNKTSQQLQQEQYRSIFLPGTQYNIRSQEKYENTIGNHRGSIRYERELDSLRTLIGYVNGRLADRDQLSDVKQQYYNLGNEHFRNQRPYSTGDGFTANMESSILFRNKFKKKGRSFLLSGTYTFNNNNTNAFQRSDIQELIVGGESFPITDSSAVNINQLAVGLSKASVLKSSVMYVEPIGKKLTWDIFANISRTLQSIDRDMFSPPVESSANRNDDLSVFYDNTINYKRLGSSMRFADKGTFVMLGLAAQGINLDGQVLNNQGGKERSTITGKYPALLPIATFRYSFSNTSRIHLSADIKESAPTINQLQPYTDNSNPMFLTTGNPDLKPSRTSTINAFFNRYDPATFFSIWSSVFYRSFRDKIVYNRQISQDLITSTSPENIHDGGDSYSGNLSVGFPIKKSKVMADMGINGSISNTPIYINQVMNNSNTKGMGVSASLNITPISWFSWFISGNIWTNYTKYSIFSQQNQTFKRQNLSSDLNFQLPNKIFITSRFNYSHQLNERINFDQHLPILGINVYKIFGKKNQHEIRLSGNDLFNRNLGVNQSASSNEVSYTNTVTLSRYIMLSYSFNMRGMKTELKRNRWE
ncbi:MAG: TonB-dependent receptor [Leadbetterella sp.]|nr:TonB-dependent receptor [Leadbetterella sp.]